MKPQHNPISAGVKLDLNWTELTPQKTQQRGATRQRLGHESNDSETLRADTWQLSGSPLTVPPPSPAPQSSLCPPGRGRTCRRDEKHSGETQLKICHCIRLNQI